MSSYMSIFQQKAFDREKESKVKNKLRNRFCPKAKHDLVSLFKEKLGVLLSKRIAQVLFFPFQDYKTISENENKLNKKKKKKKNKLNYIFTLFTTTQQNI